MNRADALVPRMGAIRTSPMWRGQSIAERIHARAAITGSRKGLQPVRWALHSWQRLAWRAHTGKQSLRTLSPRWAQKYEIFTGVSPAEQSRVLAYLARCGIAPKEAYWLDLVRESTVATWPRFVFSSERGWNLAASEVVLGNHAEALASAQCLQDKVATAAILCDVGIATPATEILPRNAKVATPALAGWMRDWSGLFCKPQLGSAGRGTLAITEVDGEVTANGVPSSLAEIAIDLEHRLHSEPYLVQPLLRSALAEGLRDVVTLRVVTRWLTDVGPQLFGVLLEWPNRFGDSGYEMFTVAPDGRVVDPLIPLWIPGFDVSASKPPVARIDNLAQITTAAIAAHLAIGRLYAIAWDVALTPAGPLFLEGNAGFGTQNPQVAFSGLLPAD